MAKRKCGTCRFFQDAEIACSGWCTHPERGDLHDLVLVRRAELACRNSWDQDLWEPADEPRKPVPSAPVRRSTPSRPVVPDNPTDRVTSIDIARPVQKREAAKKHPAVAGGQESRRTGAIRQTAVVDARPEPVQPRNGVSSLEPSFPVALHGPAARRDSKEPVETSEPSGTVVVTSPPRAPQPPTPGFVGSSSEARRLAAPRDDTKPLPVEEINFAMQAEAMRRRHSRPERESRVVTELPETAPDKPVIHVDGLAQEVGAKLESFQAEPPPTVSPLDDTPWVAGIPRCCDTCREFHRDATGKSGYCRNPYAFGGRTMVKSDQLACRSSIGVWWLPSDDTWLERADISHHTRPTPYLDAILEELRPESR